MKTILHVAPLPWHRPTGLTHSIPSLVRAQDSRGDVRVGLLNSTTTVPPADLPIPNYFGRSRKVSLLGLSNLPSPFDRPDLVVFHSTYIPFHLRLGFDLTRLGIPYCITPRGGLTAGAQSIKPFRKKVSNKLVFRRFVSGAAGLHFLSRGEKEASSGFEGRSFIAGNGTEVPKAQPEKECSSDIRFITVGRIDIEHKGLDLLLEAWSIFRRQENAPASLSIYGSGQHEETQRLYSLADKYKVRDSVRFEGAVRGSKKIAAFSNADAFVACSRFEGHPMAVLEALAFSLPCLLTPGTNMSDEVVEAGAGWKMTPSAVEIAATFNEVVRLRTSLPSIGRHGRLLVENHYSWPIIAEKTLSGYAALLDERSI